MDDSLGNERFGYENKFRVSGYIDSVDVEHTFRADALISSFRSDISVQYKYSEHFAHGYKKL